MRNVTRGFTLISGFALVWLAVVGAILVGWVMNLQAVIAYAGTSPELAKISLLMVLRIVGIFMPPIGALMGYFA